MRTKKFDLALTCLGYPTTVSSTAAAELWPVDRGGLRSATTTGIQNTLSHFLRMAGIPTGSILAWRLSGIHMVVRASPRSTGDLMEQRDLASYKCTQVVAPHD